MWQNAEGGGTTYSKNERLHLAQAALDAVPQGGIIVEVGSYGGLSLSVLLQVARERKARVFACDPFVWNPEIAEPHLRQVLCLFPDVDWRFYPLTSEKTRREMWANLEIYFLHIDGDHRAVAEDCRLWLPLVKRQGVVAFHDASPDPRNEQGYQVFCDMEEATGSAIRGSWETIWRGEGENWLTIKRKP